MYWQTTVMDCTGQVQSDQQSDSSYKYSLLFGVDPFPFEVGVLCHHTWIYQLQVGHHPLQSHRDSPLKATDLEL